MLEVASTHKRFGSVVAVEDVSFQVPTGSVCGLIGPNGAGKTTTMRLILGICEPDGGRIAWEGRPVGQAQRHRFAYVPEERGLYPRMRVEDQLLLFASLGGRRGVEGRHAVDRWIERLGLEEYRRRPGNDLSKGNARKAQLAVALLNDPVLVVLDEPFEGLDPVNVRTVKEVLQERVAAGTTFLLSSHTMDFVEDLCDRVALIHHGRTAVVGPLEDVRARSRRRILRLRLEGCAPEDYARFEAALSLAPGRQVRDGGRVYDLDRGRAEGEHAQRLMDAARAAGVVVLFSVGPPNLEEVYIELVEGKGA